MLSARMPRWLARPGARVLDSVSGLPSVRRIHDRTTALMTERSLAFSDAALEALGLSVRVAREDLERIPAKGPLIVVANHHYGGVEGVVLASVLARARAAGHADIKLIGNYLLAVFAGLRPQLIPVDPFSNSSSNAPALRQATRHVRGGGCLIVFPAGEVSILRARNPLAPNTNP